MRYLLLLIVVSIALGCDFNKSQVETKTLNSDNQKFKLKLSQDSGYISKKEGLALLLSANMTDTSESRWNLTLDNDTIGKYYKVNTTSNYYVCLLDHSSKFTFETHVLFELKGDGTILKNERFVHGNYPCCWNNAYDGFKMVGDYFLLKICRTGSGYCSSSLYLFKNIIAQGKQDPIIESYWSSETNEGLAHSLNSNFVIKNNEVIMNYTLEKGILDSNAEFKINKIEKFKVKYLMKEGKWAATDSTKLRQLFI